MGELGTCNEDSTSQLKKKLDRVEDIKSELSPKTKVDEDQQEIQHEPMDEKWIEIIERVLVGHVINILFARMLHNQEQNYVE